MVEDPKHFNQAPKRKAEFIQPPNILKEKVGTGGLSETVLKKAQQLIENNNYDFRPQGEMILDAMLKAMTEARRPNGRETEEIISAILFPAMQLKTNAGMFHYELITDSANKLVEFLEVVENLDLAALEVIEGFYTMMRAIFIAQLKGNGGAKGQELYRAMIDACNRYFEKYSSITPQE